jgi:hypothetical protein
MKVRIYKAPDGKGKFVNKLGSFMQKAASGLQVANLRSLREEILDMGDQGDDLETIADTIANNYSLDYYDVYDEVQTLLGSAQDVPPTEEGVTTDGQTTPIVETPIDYDLTSNTGEELADDMEEGWGDEQGSNAEMKRGGSTSKKTFVKGVMRTLKKAEEGMEQEDSNVASTTDLPFGGRKGFVSDWKQGVKNLGNEFYAKQMYDQAQNTQMMQPEMQPGLETASKGREVRKAKSDFEKAFGDMAVGYMGVPGMPNYLQTINVVDPSKMPQAQAQQGQQPTMPGIDFQYKKGPWWSGQREWSAKGVPVGMMMGMPGGNMQGMGMPGAGYMPINPYAYSYSGKRQVPGKIITETTTRLINRAADPANPVSENKGVLNNNPESNPISPNWLAETSIDPQVFSAIQNIKTNELEQRRRAAADFENTPEAADLSQDEYSSRLAGYGVRPYETTFDPYGLEDEARLDGEYEGALNNAGSVDWDLLTKAYGGSIDQSQMQPGVLAKFFTGGNDASPMVQYQDNDINTKNVDDPYGYAEGGLIKAAPGYTVTSNPNAVNNMIPEYTSPAHQQYAPGTTTAQNRAAFDEMVRRGVLDASSKYDPAKSYASIDKPAATNQGTTTQGNTTQVNNQGYAPQFSGYATAPSVKEQIKRMFNPVKSQFTWASQTGPATDMNGNQIDVSAMGPLSNYVQDYTYTKSPWYKGGDKTLNVTNRYVGADGKPVAGTTPAAQNKPGVGIYAPGMGVNAGMKPQTNTGQSTPSGNNDYSTRSNVKGLEDESRVSVRAGERAVDRQTRRGMRKDPDAFYEGPVKEGMTAPMSDEDYMAKVKANSATESNKQYLESTWGDVRSDLNLDDQKALDDVLKNSTNKEQIDEGLTNVLNTRSQRLQGTEEMQQRSQQEKINQQSMQKNPMMLGYAFGGSALSRFVGGGINAGTGPFDPNMSTFDANTDVNQDECTEFEKRDPNSPCYNANANIPAFAQPGASLQSMMGMEPKKQQPQDFQVGYKLNKATEISGDAVSNLGKLGSGIVQGADKLNQTAYNENYTNERIASSDQKEPTNDLDYTGGYSGQNQRHVGAPRFNSVVGEAAFVRYGGTPNYEQGGEYNMSQEELLRFMAQGGQIEFI